MTGHRTRPSWKLWRRKDSAGKMVKSEDKGVHSGSLEVFAVPGDACSVTAKSMGLLAGLGERLGARHLANRQAS